jgi:hypothetical protein
MIRTLVAVVGGYAAWTAIWLGGNAVLFGEATEVVAAGERYAAAGPLVGVIALSIVCSLIAGVTTTVIAKKRSRSALLVVAALLLVTGIGVQSGVWNLMPAWYHLAFLALLIPMVLSGGKLAGSRAT